MKNKVKYYRQEQKITQEQMGNLLGITRQTIGALEQGRYDPPITMAYKISVLLNQPLKELFDFNTIDFKTDK